ncbi:hypothetical protein [Streptomyces sp. SID14478]|uniref:hypothetical protein n=1 Tax=Streptomyces sp. SID14478 TaxID=2706073 RepID=UPI0031BA5553
MPGTRTMRCESCKSHHPHRRLDKDEQQRLKKTGEKHPGTFWLCTGPLAGGECRTLRTGFNSMPFGPPPRKLA